MYTKLVCITTVYTNFEVNKEDDKMKTDKVGKNEKKAEGFIHLLQALL
jgi:hypothetical protein